MAITEAAVMQCCACVAFARQLANQNFSDATELLREARHIWWQKVSIAGWLEAFAAHPRIGDVEGLRKKFGSFADMSRGEQSGAASASESILQELATWNRKYEERFGHIFIICASGKSAAFMLEAIKARLDNTPYKELSIAAAEQMKITEMRLKALFPNRNPAATVERRTGQMRAHLEIGASSAQQPPQSGKQLTSPITSHVLDTARGRPAEGVQIMLERRAAESKDIWELIAASTTNRDGRVPDLLPPAPTIQPGTYRVVFNTEEYMAQCKKLHPDFFSEKPFYPFATVVFEVTPDQASQHFHIPLTWNPFGYSTYRGS